MWSAGTASEDAPRHEEPQQDVAALTARLYELEQANRFLADRIDALMNVHHAAILIIDPETGLILDGNLAAVRRYARGRDDLLRRRIEEINTLRKSEIAVRMRQAVAANRNHFEFRHRLIDGTIQDVDVYSGPIRFDGRTALISFIHDATRRKAIERKLKAMVGTDPLTGCCNRRRFLSVLRHEFVVSRRNRIPLTVAILDIDRFKTINDTFGHPAGDSMIKALVSSCGKEIRESDCLGRLGGEEFGIILPATSPVAARQVLERVLEAAERTRVRLPQGEIGATVSIGISAIADGDSNEHDPLRRADAALYAAKAGGRNRIEMQLG